MGSTDGERSGKMVPDPQKSASKFSFSLPSKSSAKSKPTPSEDKEHQEDEEKPEFLNEFDPSKPAAKKLKVIPKLENSWRPEKKMKNIQMTDAELQFEPEADAPAEGVDPKVEYGLNVRTHVSDSMEIDQDEAKSELGFVSLEQAERHRLRESIDELPEEAPLEAYDSLPVEDFGAALLRGMGWSEGKGIGRSKEAVKPVEYVRRIGREGLGATPAPPVEKPKKFVKPGESREGRRDLVAAPGPDGRSRNVVGVGEKLVERQRKGVAVGKIMCIVDGRHMGLRAEVIEVVGGSSDERVVLRLCKSEEKVVVGAGEVADVDSVEEEDCLRRLKEMRVDGSGHGGERRIQNVYKDEGNSEVRSRDRDMNRNSGSRDEKRDSRGGDYGNRDEKRTNGVGREEKERDYRFRDDKRDSRSMEQRKSSYDDNRDEKRYDRRGEDRERQSRKSELHMDKGHWSEKGHEREDGRQDKYHDTKESGRRDSSYDRKESGRRDDSYDRKERRNLRDGSYDRKEGRNIKDERVEQRESRDRSIRNERDMRRKESRTEEDSRKTGFDVKTSENKSRSDNEIEQIIPVVSWLTSHIRVRVISKDFEGGKLYLKKGRVIDVVDPTTCDLLMDENGVMVQGVKQDVLETALPKRGGLIMVVEGKHKGVVGKLIERDSDKGVGLVRNEDTYEMLTLSLDHIAEFLGEPGEIGY